MLAPRIAACWSRGVLQVICTSPRKDCNTPFSELKLSKFNNDSGWTSNPAVSIESSAADVLGASSGAISADDAGADKLVFWDYSASKLKYLTFSDLTALP